MSKSPATPPSGPSLILVPAGDSAPGLEPVILGLSLGERARLAARRAGYAQMEIAPASVDAPIGNLVIAPRDILAETGWLKTAAVLRGGRWASSESLVLVPAGKTADALRILAAPDVSWRNLHRRLSELLGVP